MTREGESKPLPPLTGGARSRLGKGRRAITSAASALAVPAGASFELDKIGQIESSSLDAAAAPSWSREEFEKAILPLVPRLYRLARALSRDPSMSEDILQNALLRAYVHRGSYEGRCDLLGWLYAIVRHEYVEVTRTSARRRSLFDSALDRIGTLVEDLLGVAPPNPEEWVVSSCNADALWAALEQVSEPYRAVLVLCDIEEMSYGEISQMLKIPRGTVKSRHARGRARLREVLEREGDRDAARTRRG